MRLTAAAATERSTKLVCTYPTAQLINESGGLPYADLVTVQLRLEPVFGIGRGASGRVRLAKSATDLGPIYIHEVKVENNNFIVTVREQLNMDDATRRGVQHAFYIVQNTTASQTRPITKPEHEHAGSRRQVVNRLVTVQPTGAINSEFTYHLDATEVYKKLVDNDMGLQKYEMMIGERTEGGKKRMHHIHIQVSTDNVQIDEDKRTSKIDSREFIELYPRNNRIIVQEKFHPEILTARPGTPAQMRGVIREE